eukprot:63295-Chlamydomonas_euryale.AAC.1
MQDRIWGQSPHSSTAGCAFLLSPGDPATYFGPPCAKAGSHRSQQQHGRSPPPLNSPNSGKPTFEPELPSNLDCCAAPLLVRLQVYLWLPLEEPGAKRHSQRDNSSTYVDGDIMVFMRLQGGTLHAAAGVGCGLRAPLSHVVVCAIR